MHMSGSSYLYTITNMERWDRWDSIGDFLEELVAHDLTTQHPRVDRILTFSQFLNEAFELARKHGWSGQVDAGPYVFALPTGASGPEVNIAAWSEGEAGITYIASPYPLPWLQEPAPVERAAIAATPAESAPAEAATDDTAPADATPEDNANPVPFVVAQQPAPALIQ